jgi:small nuclear ribonucleoprotein (snRNP)-like protein
LEAYYSLIAPDQIANNAEWLSKFDKIAAKYGGSHDGERQLARKLQAKYGSSVRLLLAASVEVVKDGNRNQPQGAAGNQWDESWFQLNDKESHSGILDFCSGRFDPVAALTVPKDQVMQANPFLSKCPRLDRMEQCRSKLPDTDPSHREEAVRKAIAATEVAPKRKRTSLFSPLLDTLSEQGPFAVLHQALAERKRVRVVVRYVNGIRGTLTGHLMAFDKHMNLILCDVLEVYSLRCTTERGTTSNLEQELARRQEPVRQRHLRHMMVRGDNVVLTYFAESERSAFPQTSKSPKGSMYYASKKKEDVELGQTAQQTRHLGTLGSLLFAQQRQRGKKFSTDK